MADADYPLRMASDAGTAPSPRRLETDLQLSDDWRRLGRAATAVAVVTAPVAFTWFHAHNGWGFGWSLAATILEIAAFRGVVDVVLRKLIPWPSLFGTDDARLRAEDAINRRRAWYWRKWVRRAIAFFSLITFIWWFRIEVQGKDVGWVDTLGGIFHGFVHVLSTPQLLLQMVFVVFLFLANFLIFFGPMMLMGISQIRAFEPGDAEWGVKLDDVRGQAEAKEEVRQVVNLWQSGESFEKAGGKRERGVLFRGAPGTGKTMLAKAIATGFNSPFVTIPGSGFAQTFIGVDVLVVRFLAAKARRLARKWGGTCIVFIDEIDAVAMRRQALGSSHTGTSSLHDFLFFGPNGALNPTGDMIMETRAWREKLFEARAPERALPSGLGQRAVGIFNQAFPGMFGGGMGQMALNQLLVVMDGIDNPPFAQRVLTNRINTFLDALYIVPQRIGGVPLRVPRARPTGDQIYFIGATNVPMEALDPALTRPGRMGRHVWFRTPTKQDRVDIFDLYLGKVSHEPDLDRPERRDELARITMGYSPAMIDQVCSMALTLAHHDGRERFGWADIVEAMTNVESGTAVNIEYIPEETRAVAIHEAGHAIAAHVYSKRFESTRLSIRMRGGSLGHHSFRERDERFSSWRSELMGLLTQGLGAMAAERVFYGENSSGVGGDVQTVTATAGYMVGEWGMGPDPIEVPEGKFADETVEETRKRIAERYQRLGSEIMNRTGGGGPFHHDPISSVLGDPEKRRMAAQMLGQAYFRAYNLVAANRPAVERVASELVARREIHGDEVVRLLDSLDLEVPDSDPTDDAVWPKL